MFEYFDIEGWMLYGPLAEELADEEEQLKQIERDYEEDDDSDDVV